MVDFPNIKKPGLVGFEEETVYPQIRSEFESGVVQSRPAFTKARQRWVLRWNALSDSDYSALITFFKANQGNTWNWTHPATSEVFVCRFSEDSIRSKVVAPGLRQLEVPIEEA
ncbi:MAG: hypothetical protein AB1896_14905 [Thermodesulfobacteriota bacterium]